MRNILDTVQKVNNEMANNAQLAVAGPPASAPAPVVKLEVNSKCLQQVQKLCNTLGEPFRMLNNDDLCKFCLLIMADPSASHKDKLAAAKLYAQLKGYLDKDKQKKGVNGARIRWASAPIDVEAVPG